MLCAEMIIEGKAKSTVHQTHVVAHSSLDEAVNWGLIPFNPVDRVKLARVTSPEIVPPTKEQAMQFLDAAEHDRLKALWFFIALTDCRRCRAETRSAGVRLTSRTAGSRFANVADSATT